MASLGCDAIVKQMLILRIVDEDECLNNLCPVNQTCNNTAGGDECQSGTTPRPRDGKFNCGWEFPTIAP